MPTTMLTRVKSKLFVHARRRSRGMLEGEYASVFHGRSLDYDDLRDYVIGDEVRDIDWKASARHTRPLVKRYVANRKQNLVLVVDTGRGMAATTRSGESKKDVAVAAAGLVGWLAQRHGDLVGLVRGTASSTVSHDLRGTEAHLELLLRAVDGATRLDGEQSNLAVQLRWIVQNVKRRLFLLVVADDRDLDPALDELLRRLHVQHEILWLTVEDADPTAIDAGVTAYDVADGYSLPTGVRLDPKVRAAWAAETRARVQRTNELLDRRAINHARVGSTDEVVTTVFALLERQRRARR
ncbi:DUF58 domain-containing protein [Terracoccus luteus]|uniref:Uncharacterized protein (DUF58 family) n=1 Tax=Terracoccus luteus TaxID=53356 RepID=A0A839PQ28_9MICO|nr:DUF58 domain-containing protein [Terracoccus luteus]MBB2984914.1 uncharacterized protein (DUF58 family) [Terracoccus luteus]MCP2170566.1 uncharacterized protein (DUF58 family) [Terracoccus luteus]